jgi:hypothetical protein
VQVHALRPERDAGEAPKLHLFGQLERIRREWIEQHLECRDGFAELTDVFEIERGFEAMLTGAFAPAAPEVSA